MLNAGWLTKPIGRVLARTVYTDLKRTAPKVQADVLARSLRVTLRDRGGPLTPNQERIVDVVASETLNHETQQED